MNNSNTSKARRVVYWVFLALILTILVLVFVLKPLDSSYKELEDGEKDRSLPTTETSDTQTSVEEKNSIDNFDYKDEEDNQNNTDMSEALLLYEQANALYSQNKYEESINLYNNAIYINPYYPSFFEKKAETLIRLNRKDEALATIEEGLKNNPEDPNLLSTYEIIQNTK